MNIAFGAYCTFVRLVTIYSHTLSKNWVIVEFRKVVKIYIISVSERVAILVRLRSLFQSALSIHTSKTKLQNPAGRKIHEVVANVVFEQQPFV